MYGVARTMAIELLTIAVVALSVLSLCLLVYIRGLNNLHAARIIGLTISNKQDETARKLAVEMETTIAASSARKDALKRSRSGIKGRVAEQFAPMMAEFKHDPSDARFIGSPIDYVVFKNYSLVKDGANDEPITIVFVEIKRGKSTLNTHQRRIRDAINEGRVRWEEVKID